MFSSQTLWLALCQAIRDKNQSLAVELLDQLRVALCDGAPLPLINPQQEPVDGTSI